MATDLKRAHRKSGFKYGSGWPAHLGELDKWCHKEGAVECDECELDECKGDRVSELVHDLFSRIRRHGRGGIPQRT